MCTESFGEARNLTPIEAPADGATAWPGREIGFLWFFRFPKRKNTHLLISAPNPRGLPAKT